MRRALLVVAVIVAVGPACRRGTTRPSLEFEGYETRTWVGDSTTTTPPRAGAEPAANTGPPPPPEDGAPAAAAPPRAPVRGWERAEPW